MKKFKFAVHNWKSGLPPFWMYKEFPSAYEADRYTIRVSFKKRNSPYMVITMFGEEE